MANASAKKAAAARRAAAATYFPIVLALNLGYTFLRLVYLRDSVTVYNCVVAAALVALSCVSYQGILADHAHPSVKGGNSDALAGGASLDLLGLVTLVQYGTLLINDKLYWALAAIPLWGGWKLYGVVSSTRGGPGGMLANQTNADAPVDDAAVEKAEKKRQKRSERRRQKWA